MKTLKLIPVFIIAFLFCNYTSVAQDNDETYEDVEVENENESTIATGTYVGMEEGKYIFSFEDEDGENNAMSFEKVSPEVKKMFDLSSEKFIGETFKMGYITDNTIDESDDEMLVSIRIILTLKQL